MHVLKTSNMYVFSVERYFKGTGLYINMLSVYSEIIFFVDIQFRVFRGYGNLRIHDPNEVFIHFCNIAHN